MNTNLAANRRTLAAWVIGSLFVLPLAATAAPLETAEPQIQSRAYTPIMKMAALHREEARQALWADRIPLFVSADACPDIYWEVTGDMIEARADVIPQETVQVALAGFMPN